MNACGLIVEYNPFHNGHYYHIQEARKVSGADCIIAVMSGNFLQRGEPAVIDKFHRAKAALASGADIVLELPYAFAVQNSDHFAVGAVKVLNRIGVTSICFGSESGKISHFTNSYYTFQKQKSTYNKEIKKWLNNGYSFPEASMHAYKTIGLSNEDFDLSLPNNILGYSYVKAILDNNLPIHPLTIKRYQNDFHQAEITNPIASATSIRKELFDQNQQLTPKIAKALPEETITQLKKYKQTAGTLHNWEHYFTLLHYRIQTMSSEELQEIQGVDEGIQHRIKKTAKSAENMNDWIASVKSRRYTWTRIQRMFIHILTNTTKTDLAPYLEKSSLPPYIRLLGMTKQGQAYLNKIKKDIDVEIITGLTRTIHPLLQMEERATNAYYSMLIPIARKKLFKQEITSPIIL